MEIISHLWYASVEGDIDRLMWLWVILTTLWYGLDNSKSTNKRNTLAHDVIRLKHRVNVVRLKLTAISNFVFHSREHTCSS